MEQVLRVNQLDATELDDNLIEILEHQFIRIFTPLQSIRVQQLGPELKAIVRFLVWRFSMYNGDSTFGQGMLELAYTDSHSQPLGVLHRGGLFVTLVLVDWLLERSDWMISKLPHHQAALHLLNWTQLTTKALSLFNFIIFLVFGSYPTLKERLLNLKIVPRQPQTIREISHNYLTREILWHGFSEFIFFVLPHFNLFSIKNWLRRCYSAGLASTPSNTGLCAFCGNPPTLPHLSDCGHLYCYYCIAANLLADANFSCLSCNEVVHEVIPASEVIT